MSEATPGGAPAPSAPSSDAPITLSGSETITSFDDISAIDPTNTGKKKDVGSKPAPKEKSESTPDNEPPKPTEAEAKKIRKILARMGDQDLELTPDTLIKHKISGEEVDIALGDVLNDYAGKTDWSRKYTELDKAKKSIAEKDRVIQKFDGTMRHFSSLAKEDPSQAFEYLLESYGHNGRDVIKNLHSQWAEQHQELMELDEPSRFAREKEADAEYYKRKLEMREQKERQQRESEQLSTRISTLREQYNIPEQDFVAAYHELAASPEYQQMRKENPEFKLEPENVAKYYSIKQFRTNIQDYLADIGHPAINDLQSVYEQISFISQRFPNLGQKELLAVVKKSFGEGKAPKKENPLKDRILPKKETVQNVKRHEPINFDDI